VSWYDDGILPSSGLRRLRAPAAVRDAAEDRPVEHRAFGADLGAGDPRRLVFRCGANTAKRRLQCGVSVVH